MEESLVLSCACEIAFDQFDPEFTVKVAQILQIVQDYNPKKDQELLEWFLGTKTGKSLVDLELDEVFARMKSSGFDDSGISLNNFSTEEPPRQL